MKKIYSLKELKGIIEEHKRGGDRVVLANGCFDLIHVGHIRYLKEAKNQGDILIVALNSDASVRRLKGPGRPILPEAERVAIVGAMASVDYVTLFSEDTVEHVLLALRPHVHAKGSDYSTDTVPEKDTVRGYGGRIAITGGPKVKNTSDLIKEIADRVGHE